MLCLVADGQGPRGPRVARRRDAHHRRAPDRLPRRAHVLLAPRGASKPPGWSRASGSAGAAGGSVRAGLYPARSATTWSPFTSSPLRRSGSWASLLSRQSPRPGHGPEAHASLLAPWPSLWLSGPLPGPAVLCWLPLPLWQAAGAGFSQYTERQSFTAH